MRVFLIAGEASGDALGAALIAGLRQLVPELGVSGVGGPLMEAQGLRSLFPMDELSVMGLAEVLPKYRALKRRIAQTAAAVLADPPDVLISIDSPDFCLRVARIVRAARPGLRTIHYVAPSVWAWRPGRAAKMARSVDHVLALLPFEPPYMRAAGMGCDFVGHPVVAAPRAGLSAAQAFRAAHGIGDAPLILALPGSRRGEVTRHAAPFGAALAQVVARLPEARVVLPTVAGVADLAAALAARWPGRPVLIDPRRPGAAEEKAAAFAAADVALAASGTVSLELAANRVPMVIAYQVHPVTRLILRMMLRTDTVTLVNLVSETRAVPEFLGARCLPGPIADAVTALLRDGTAREAQRAAMETTMRRLGEGGEDPGLRAARAVLSALDPAASPRTAVS